MNKTMQKIILYGSVVVFVVGIAALLFTSRDNIRPTAANTNTQSASALAAAETNFDFGTIAMQNGNVSHQFELKNEGTDPVTIQKVYTSCMCTNAYVKDASGKRHGAFGMPGHAGSGKTNIVVAPGTTVTIEAVFDPAAHGPSGVGLAERAVYLETNSTVSPQVEFNFRANVTR
ncbi:MAG: DUF1573 domain-containing protein [Candidatus Wildermuthbacteria bacterium]|nr:DUF1573 domain-containing protein [Candidatus Wildermuthbacteria bacterium]